MWWPRRAISYLSASDPTLGKVIAKVGPCRFEPRLAGGHFGALARSIIYQQLSNKAAATIHGRFLNLFDGKEPSPSDLVGVSESALRLAGISNQKLRYIKDLANRAASGALRLDELDQLPDEEILRTLTGVKGIGIWTAQMFLIFRLGRPDVLAGTDLSIQKAIQFAYELKRLPSPQRIERLGSTWKPFRSVACWYLWRSLDNGIWS